MKNPLPEGKGTFVFGSDATQAGPHTGVTGEPLHLSILQTFTFSQDFPAEGCMESNVRLNPLLTNGPQALHGQPASCSQGRPLPHKALPCAGEERASGLLLQPGSLEESRQWEIDNFQPFLHCCWKTNEKGSFLIKAKIILRHHGNEQVHM